MVCAWVNGESSTSVYVDLETNASDVIFRDDFGEAP